MDPRRLTTSLVALSTVAAAWVGLQARLPPAQATPAAVAPTPTSGASPSPPPTPRLTAAELTWLNSPWRAQFADHFSGNRLSGRWQHCYPWKTCTNQTNGEYQWYQPGNAQVAGGRLHLMARRQSVTRTVVPGMVRTFPYTSAMVQTSTSYAAREGRIEVRARSVAGKAVWPALWLLPLDQSWPPEIDFFEQYGDPTHFEQTVHLAPGVKEQINHDSFNPTTRFHTYAVQWSPIRIVMMVDGRVTGISRSVRPDKPLYLLMNLAIGGNWVGAPTSATPRTADLQIDSVVAYGPAGSNVLAR